MTYEFTLTYTGQEIPQDEMENFMLSIQSTLGADLGGEWQVAESDSERQAEVLL